MVIRCRNFKFAKRCRKKVPVSFKFSDVKDAGTKTVIGTHDRKSIPLITNCRRKLPGKSQEGASKKEFGRLTSKPKILLSHTLQLIRLTNKTGIFVDYKLPTKTFFSFKVTSFNRLLTSVASNISYIETNRF